MNKKKLIFLSLLLIYIVNVNSQNGFQFKEKSNIKQRISFKLINNLIVIPIEINGRFLSFILDTGVSKTIVFNVSDNDSIRFQNPEKISLYGLGGGAPVDAILSKNNVMKIKGLASNTESIYIILKDFFDLSSRMGTTIHGIVGYDLLKNFIVKINYKSKKIDFYNPKKYKYKKCRKCAVLPIQFYRKKPYVNVSIQLDTIGSKLTEVKMLVDSGGSDAIWLFEDSKSEIKTPKRFFKDILGEGLSGSIFGNRSRIPMLKIDGFEIKNPTASFLDTLSTLNARKFKNRNGSLGGNVLRRFKVWLDYPNRRITLKKNASFKAGFTYNMSGLDIVYNGTELVKVQVVKPSGINYNLEADGSKTISFLTDYSYKFKPRYKIKGVVKNSAGDKAGLKPGDIIIRVNRKLAHTYKLSEIINILQERDRKKVRIKIEREGKIMSFQFRLEKKI